MSFCNAFFFLLLCVLSNEITCSNGFLKRYSSLSMLQGLSTIISSRKSSAMQKLKAVIESTRAASAGENIKLLLDSGPVPQGERKFLINGWRWHTASVIRDLNRFENVLVESEKQQVQTEDISKRISKCFSFVFDFNWKACMRVERELFFPWLQTMLPKSLNYLFEDLYTKHDTINSLIKMLERQCATIASDPKGYSRARDLVNELRDCAMFIQAVQESTFIPYITAYVDKKEQEKFNNRVIARLGLLESQIHLVSMREAIAGNRVEEEMFKQQIPYVARSLIPLWKNRLYYPKASCLDFI